MGYHPYPVPTATLSRSYTNPDGITRTGCAYCGYCTRYGCMIGAKAQPTNILMPVLQKRKNFTLRNRLLGAPHGRIGRQSRRRELHRCLWRRDVCSRPAS